MRRLRSDERGFTIIEVLVASVLMIVGLFGVVTMVDAANTTDTTTKAREQGVSLARELIDAGRSIGYAQLQPSSIVSKVQAMPGLANANAGSGWTIVRRGVTYTVAMGTCAIDDPSDGVGTEDPNEFCASQNSTPTVSCNSLLSVGITASAALLANLQASAAAQATMGLCGIDANLDGRIDNLTQAEVALCVGAVCQATPTTPPQPADATPDDYKRIEAVVTWSVGSGSRSVLLSTAVNNPGIPAGPHVTKPAAGTRADPIVPFTLTADSTAVAVQWSVNGTPQGSATLASGTWSFNWNVGTAGAAGTQPAAGEVLDGNYTIAATAFDTNGNPGPTVSTTYVLNRRQPYAPTNFAGGRNGSIVDFQWTANKEGDIAGYQVYRVVAGGPDALVCSTSNAHSATCNDTSPPSGSLIQYYAVAVDPTDSTAGDHSSVLNVTTTNQAPNPVTNLQTSTSNGNTVLAWQQPCPTDPDGVDGIDFYRVYRDGQALGNRYDTVPGANSLTNCGGTAPTVTYTDTATGGVAHNYWVTAVDPQLAESTAVGPVNR